MERVSSSPMAMASPPSRPGSIDLGRFDKVDWDMVYQRYWADNINDMDRQRRKQAEFLVHRFCDWSLILEIGVVNRTLKRESKRSWARFMPGCTARWWFIRDWYY